MHGRHLNATGRTLLLSASLVLIAVGLAARAPAGPLLDTGLHGHGPQIVVLTVLFCLGELCLLHVEVRRQAYSITLAGVPLALGLLLCGPRELVVARVIGSFAAFLIQRSPALKVGYNLSAYAAEAAIDATLAHAVLGHSPTLSATTAGTCLVVIALADQLMSLLVVTIITWHQGALSRRDCVAVMLPALLGSVFATTGAIAGTLLARSSVLGMVVFAVLVLGAACAYRGYQVLHRRHRALEQMHEFVGLNTGTEEAGVLARRMLEQTRALMRATRAELFLIDGGTVTEIVVGESGEASTAERTGAVADSLARRVSEERQPTLIPRNTRDPHLKRWLKEHQATDAVLVPLPKAAGDGALVIVDRLGDTGSFTPEDLTLLQTLAGHLGMAVRGTKLLDRLRFDATHDSLTGLANRGLLSTSIRRELERTGGTGTAVLLLDLDRFKEVNDTLGHHVGDELLAVIGRRLTEALPHTATIARLGGDEFAAVVPGLKDVRAEAAQWGEALATAIAVPVPLPEATLTTRASIGIALSSPGATASDLLRHADTAMYAAKADREGVTFYDAELDRGRVERLALIADLHAALERDELTVRYQPKLDLLANRITSVEALVRWQHPRLGLLSPDAFIPLAETAGLIGPLTLIVLRTALAQAARWRDDGLDLTVAVNLSARSVNDPRLPEIVTTALLEAGLPAQSLILEITESSVMQDAEGAVEILERLAAIGVTLSLDDFGTGYSSLAYLQRLPVREVKIDRTFVSRLISTDARSDVLIRSIIGLASSLDLRVVAEGVEDVETLDLLRTLGCHRAQGYYISRPETGDDVSAHLDTYPGVSAAPSLRAVSA